jgi:Flp pilus assembly pilin Flp
MTNIPIRQSKPGVNLFLPLEAIVLRGLVVKIFHPQMSRKTLREDSVKLGSSHPEKPRACRAAPYAICIRSLADFKLRLDRMFPVKQQKKFNNRGGKRGQTLVEYALILAFISVVAISVLIRLGNEVRLIFTTITSQLAVASSSH